jgi:hypothetical protein
MQKEIVLASIRKNNDNTGYHAIITTIDNDGNFEKVFSGTYDNQLDVLNFLFAQYHDRKLRIENIAGLI